MEHIGVTITNGDASDASVRSGIERIYDALSNFVTSPGVVELTTIDDQFECRVTFGDVYWAARQSAPTTALQAPITTYTGCISTGKEDIIYACSNTKMSVVFLHAYKTADDSYIIRLTADGSSLNYFTLDFPIGDTTSSTNGNRNTYKFQQKRSINSTKIAYTCTTYIFSATSTILGKDSYIMVSPVLSRQVFTPFGMIAAPDTDVSNEALIYPVKDHTASTVTTGNTSSDTGSFWNADEFPQSRFRITPEYIINSEVTNVVDTLGFTPGVYLHAKHTIAVPFFHPLTTYVADTAKVLLLAPNYYKGNVNIGDKSYFCSNYIALLDE